MGSAKLDRYAPSNSGIKALLKGNVAESIVRTQANRVRARARSMFGAKSYGVRVKVGANRVRGFVYTADKYAMRSNLKHNTLAKAKGGR